MNIFTKIYKSLFPSKMEEVTTELKELEFRVVTHFSGSRYYCLECKGKWGWYKVTELYKSCDGQYDSLDQPVLGSFDELVKMAKKFKSDPPYFEAYKQRQIDEYNKRQKAYRDKIKKHDERVEYI